MNLARRGFVRNGILAGAALVAGGGAWLGLSRSRRAALLRQVLADFARQVPAAPAVPNPAAWNDNQLTLAWLGHASVLFNFRGMRILTDPVLFNHVGVETGLGTFGPKRLVRCALNPARIPEVDLLLLSHAHLDHLDIASLKALRGRPKVVTAWDTADLLNGLRLGAKKELRWGDSTVVSTGRGDVMVRAFEVKHWGRRWPRGRERGYNGYVLERDGRRIIFGGDTAYLGSFRTLRAWGPYECALMPIGAYNPWIHNHCTPEEAVRMARAAGAQRIAPIHYATFKFSDEPLAEPLERFDHAMQGSSESIAWRQAGETWVCS